MNEQPDIPRKEEESLVKLYTDLTGASESSARAVFMHVDTKGSNASEATDDAASSSTQAT